MEYSNFKIHIELPNGTKQIVWELTEEGDISTNKKKEQQTTKRVCWIPLVVLE